MLAQAQGMKVSFSVVLILAALGIGCRHTTPAHPQEVDHTGWVEITNVAAVDVPRIHRLLQREGIPDFMDARGYPYYPLFVPPEYTARARELMVKKGYVIHEPTLVR